MKLYPIRLQLIACGAAISLLLSGCPSDHGHPHGPGGHDDHGAHGSHGGHGHGNDGEKTEAITVFSERHELFIEHPFLLKEKPARFITHVTDIVARKPRTQGPVTFVMQLGSNEPLEHEVPELARTGIYLPEIAFPQAGEWRVSLRIPHDGGSDLVALPNRIVYASQEIIDQALEPADVDGISFLKEQQWKLDFQTVAVSRASLTERIQLPGRLLAPPSGSAFITPPLAGVLLPPEGGSLPVLGQQVKAGQILARIQPPLAGSDHLTFLSSRQQLTALRLEMQTSAAEAQSEATRAQIALRRAEQQLTRVRDLARQQAKSPREVEQAEYEHARAAATVQAAESRQRLYSKVEEKLSKLPGDLSEGFPAVALKAPIAGIVIEASGAHGEQVEGGKPLFAILDRSQLLLEIKVPETAFGSIPANPDVVFTTPGKRKQFRAVLGEGGGGRLLLPAAKIDPKTRAGRLVYQLPNPGDLADGLPVEAYVSTRTANKALSIPVSALVEEEGRYVAYVMLGGETFEKRDLELGVRDSGQVEVVSGLAEGERVVNRGAYAVKLASVGTAAIGHGHGH